MIDASRRTFLIGATAAAVVPLAPALARKNLMLTKRMIRTNGIDLAVHDAGKGPPVVLLHGFPGLAESWRHQIPAFAAAGYRTIVPDLRGYGRSTAPLAVEAYDVVQLTADLAGLLDALGLDRAVFAGHDWGGLLAWQMALLHPQRVAGVVSLTAPFIPHWMLWLHPDLVRAARPDLRAFVADPAVDPVTQMQRVYTPEMYVLKFQGRSADIAMARDPRSALRGAYRKDLVTKEAWDDLPPEVTDMRYYGQPAPKELPGKDVLTAPELNFYATEFTRTGFTPAINWYRNLSRNWQAGRDLDQTIRAPALMLSAEHDVVLRPSMTVGMERYVPDLERQVIAGSWHWLQEERPDDVNRTMLAWLTQRWPRR